MAGKTKTYALPEKSTLTQHARERLAQRTKMKEADLIAQLDTMRNVQGKRLKSEYEDHHKIHRAVWSAADQEFIFVVQDIITGDVLTILTRSMYEVSNRDFASQTRLQRMANKLVYAGIAPKRFWKPTDSGKECRPHVYAIFQDGKRKALGTYSEVAKTPDVLQVCKGGAFWTWVAQRVEQRYPSMMDEISSVHAMLPGADAREVVYAG